jgi:hypothetical protein
MTHMPTRPSDGRSGQSRYCIRHCGILGRHLAILGTPQILYVERQPADRRDPPAMQLGDLARDEVRLHLRVRDAVLGGESRPMLAVHRPDGHHVAAHQTRLAHVGVDVGKQRPTLRSPQSERQRQIRLGLLGGIRDRRVIRRDFVQRPDTHPVGQHRQVALLRFVRHGRNRCSLQLDLAAAADPVGRHDQTHFVQRCRRGEQPGDQLVIASDPHRTGRSAADHNLVGLLRKNGQTQRPPTGEPAERDPAGQGILGPRQRSFAVVDPLTDEILVALQPEVDPVLGRRGLAKRIRRADRDRLVLDGIRDAHGHPGHGHRQLPRVATVRRGGVRRRADRVDLDQLAISDGFCRQHERVRIRLVAAAFECHLPAVSQRQLDSTRQPRGKLDAIIRPREDGQMHRPLVAEPTHRVLAVERHRRFGVRSFARVNPLADEQLVVRRSDVQKMFPYRSNRFGR